MEVSVSTISFSKPWPHNVRIRKFANKQAVTDAILASACVAPPPKYVPGHRYAMDGCYTDFEFCHVRISCIAIRHDYFESAVSFRKPVNSLQPAKAWEI